MKKAQNYQDFTRLQQEAFQEIGRLCREYKSLNVQDWSLDGDDHERKRAEIRKQLDNQPAAVARLAYASAMAHLRELHQDAKPLQRKLILLRKVKEEYRNAVRQEELRIRAELEAVQREKARQAREDFIRRNGTDIYFTYERPLGEMQKQIRQKLDEIDGLLREKYLGEYADDEDSEDELADRIKEIEKTARKYNLTVDIFDEKTWDGAAQAYADEWFRRSVRLKDQHLSGVFS